MRSVRSRLLRSSISCLLHIVNTRMTKTKRRLHGEDSVSGLDSWRIWFALLAKKIGHSWLIFWCRPKVCDVFCWRPDIREWLSRRCHVQNDGLTSITSEPDRGRADQAAHGGRGTARYYTGAAQNCCRVYRYVASPSIPFDWASPLATCIQPAQRFSCWIDTELSWATQHRG